MAHDVLDLGNGFAPSFTPIKSTGEIDFSKIMSRGNSRHATPDKRFFEMTSPYKADYERIGFASSILKQSPVFK